MSTVKNFFDIKYAQENKSLFDKLYISTSEYMSEQGKYPVIYLSFKDIKYLTWEKSSEKIKNLISSLYDCFEFIKEKLNKKQLITFENIWLQKENADWENSLKILSEYLHKYYNQKVVILIDEYDATIVSAYENNYYNEAMEFFRNFYSTVLKNNEFLHLGVMTGILRVAKEGIFSGLNNLTVYNILEDKFSEYFGLTEKEVKEALKYYNLEYKIEDVKEWYDGYQFGNSDIYNPWSIIKFLENQKLEAYWINTSGNDLINSLLMKADKNIFEDLQKLFNKENIYKIVDSYSNFYDFKNIEEIWQLFLNSGYLTTNGKNIENKIYPLKIPNREIYEFFKEVFIDRFLISYEKFTKVTDYLKLKNFKAFEESLQNEILSSVSYFDINSEELYYHAFINGLLLTMNDEYIITSNKESGYERYDLSIKPFNISKTGYIIEFKTAKNEKELSKKSEEALTQIKENKYEIYMKKEGINDIIGIGIAFYGKKIKLCYENL